MDPKNLILILTAALLTVSGCMCVGKEAKYLPILDENNQPVYRKTLLGKKQEMYCAEKYSQALLSTRSIAIEHGNVKIDIKDAITETSTAVAGLTSAAIDVAAERGKDVAK